MKKAILLHQECHSKDAPQCYLQRIHRETCGLAFIDLLGAGKTMVTCRKPKNLKDLVILSRMKVCDNVNLKASACVEK